MTRILGAVFALLLLVAPAVAQTPGAEIDTALDALRANDAALVTDNAAMRAAHAAIAATVGDLAVRLRALENAEPPIVPDPMPDPPVVPDPTPDPVPPVAGLLYVPPTLDDPIVVNVALPKWRYGCWPADRDVLILMPDVVFKGGMEVCGGKNVRMIGGHMVSQRNQKARRAFVITGPPSGEFFIEGFHLDTDGQSWDAMASRTRRTGYGDPWEFMLTLQNVRIEGVGTTNSRRHADIFQAQGPIGTLRIENFTGRSSFNGLVLNNNKYPTYEEGVRRLEMRNADFTHPVREKGNTFLAVLPDGKTTVSFDNVWMDAYLNNGRWSRYATEPIGGRGSRFDAGPPPRLYMDSMNAEGFISAGVPPTGDFAPASAVGLNYVSPWPIP